MRFHLTRSARWPVRQRVCAAMLAGLLAVPAAHAQTGFYVGGGLGQSHYKEPSPLTAPIDDEAPGFKAYVGYALSSGLALELGHAELGRFRAGPEDLQQGQGLFLDGVTTVSIGPGWSALGRLGVFDSRSRLSAEGRESRESRVSVKLGMGLQYQLTPRVAVRGEWERYGQRVNSQTANTDLYTLGVLVQF